MENTNSSSKRTESRVKLEVNELSCLDLRWWKKIKGKTRTLKSPDRFSKPRSVPMPKVDKWRLCRDYNKDAKAIIQSTLTNVVPFCEQMGPRVWVGKPAEYPSPSWLGDTRINGKQENCQDFPVRLEHASLSNTFMCCMITDEVLMHKL